MNITLDVGLVMSNPRAKFNVLIHMTYGTYIVHTLASSDWYSKLHLMTTISLLFFPSRSRGVLLIFIQESWDYQCSTDAVLYSPGGIRRPGCIYVEWGCVSTRVSIYLPLVAAHKIVGLGPYVLMYPHLLPRGACCSSHSYIPPTLDLTLCAWPTASLFRR